MCVRTSDLRDVRNRYDDPRWGRCGCCRYCCRCCLYVRMITKREAWTPDQAGQADVAEVASVIQQAAGRAGAGSTRAAMRVCGDGTAAVVRCRCA